METQTFQTAAKYIRDFMGVSESFFEGMGGMGEIEGIIEQMEERGKEMIKQMNKHLGKKVLSVDFLDHAKQSRPKEIQHILERTLTFVENAMAQDYMVMVFHELCKKEAKPLKLFDSFYMSDGVTENKKREIDLYSQNLSDMKSSKWWEIHHHLLTTSEQYANETMELEKLYMRESESTAHIRQIAYHETWRKMAIELRFKDVEEECSSWHEKFKDITFWQLLGKNSSSLPEQVQEQCRVEISLLEKPKPKAKTCDHDYPEIFGSCPCLENENSTPEAEDELDGSIVSAPRVIQEVVEDILNSTEIEAILPTETVEAAKAICADVARGIKLQAQKTKRDIQKERRKKSKKSHKK